MERAGVVVLTKRKSQPAILVSLVHEATVSSSSIELNIQRVASEFTDASCDLMACNAISDNLVTSFLQTINSKNRYNSAMSSNK